MSRQVPLFFQNPWVKFIHSYGYCQSLGIQTEMPGKRPCSPVVCIPEEKYMEKHVFLHEGEIMELGMRWKRQRKDERKREGKEEEEDEDGEKRGRTEERIRVNEVFQSESSDKTPRRRKLQEIWNSFAVRPESYEVFTSNSEITWAKQRDKSFEQVENPRIGHSEWNRKEWNTMSETGLDDGDRDQMMEAGTRWWRQEAGDGVTCGIWYSISLLHFMEHQLGMSALWPVHVARTN